MNHYKELVKLNAKQFIVPEIQETGLQMTRVALSLMGESDRAYQTNYTRIPYQRILKCLAKI